jgi:hypothetical protein
MTQVRKTRLYLAAAEYDRKCIEMARMLRRERGSTLRLNSGQAPRVSKEIALLDCQVQALAAEICRLEGRAS